MAICYTTFATKSHAFLMERRMKAEGVLCELTYTPKSLVMDICNMGVRFEEKELPKALTSIKRAGLPGCRVFKEITNSQGYGCRYLEVRI